jgi:hypothetical protein
MVVVGLAGSGLVNVWIEAPPPDALPGVALGSQTLLVAERGVAFFAIWLLVLVVVAQALKRDFARLAPLQRLTTERVRMEAMADDQKDIADRIFELLDKPLLSTEIAAELGMSFRDALPIILKVIDERGTPNLAAARREIDHLATIRV